MLTILYFAALGDLMGLREEALEVPERVRTVRDFMAYLQDIRPPLAGKLASVRVALDEVFADDSDLLKDARVLALIPPVAGG